MTEIASFEAALRSLEQAVEKLESGELSLEETLHFFEEGVKNASLCQKRLKEIETRVDLLLKEKDGTLVTEKFDDE